MVEKVKERVHGRDRRSYGGEAIRCHDEREEEEWIRRGMRAMGVAEGDLEGLAKGHPSVVSLAFARNVSYIVGFRQLSIPLSVVLGVAVLKEPPYRPKVIGVAIVFIGLILLAAG